MKKTVFLLIFLIFLTCICWIKIRNSPDKDERLLMSVIFSTAKKLKTEYALSLIGTGGRISDEIEMLGASFDYFREIDIDLGRQLILASIENYLRVVNSDEKIRPYLHNYPFTEKNLEIRIFLKTPKGASIPINELYYISAMNGIIRYYARAAEYAPPKELLKESYEEALHAAEIYCNNSEKWRCCVNAIKDFYHREHRVH